MKQEKDILTRCGNRRTFTVPQGYFDNLDAGIISALPQTAEPQQVNVTTWMKIRPYLYMAAAFAGLFFGIGLFVDLGNGKNGSNLAQESQITIYSDEYIDSFLETAMIDDCTFYYSLVDTAE